MTNLLTPSQSSNGHEVNLEISPGTTLPSNLTTISDDTFGTVLDVRTAVTLNLETTPAAELKSIANAKKQPSQDIKTFNNRPSIDDLIPHKPDNFSLSIWVYYDPLPEDSETILNHKIDINTGWSLKYDSGQITFAIHNRDGNLQSLSAPYTLISNTWTEIVVTYNSYSTMMLYLNGRAANQKSVFDIDFWDDKGSLTIDSSFIGRLGPLGFADYAYNSDEILDRYIQQLRHNRQFDIQVIDGEVIYLPKALLSEFKPVELHFKPVELHGNLGDPNSTTHDSNITSVAITLDGSTIVTGGSDKKAKTWQQNSDGDWTPTELHSVQGDLKSTAHNLYVASVAITPDGSTIVTGGADRKAKVWLPIGTDFGKPNATLNQKYYYLPNPRQLLPVTTPKPDFTLLSWFKIDGGVNNAELPIFGAKDLSVSGAWQLEAVDNGVKFKTKDQNSELATNLPGLNLNNWTHVAVTYNNSKSQLAIYINGREVTHDTQSSLNLWSNLAFTVGNDTRGITVSQWSITDQALTAADVLEKFKDDLSVAMPCFDFKLDTSQQKLTYTPLVNLASTHKDSLPTPVRDPWLGPCLDFDGANDTTPIVNPGRIFSSPVVADAANQSFTLSCWVYPKAASDIIGQGDPTTDGWVISAESGITVAGQKMMDSERLVSGAWNHLAISYDGTQLTAYINGQASGSTQDKAGYDWWGKLSPQLFVGHLPGSYFSGRLGPITVYRGLQADKVQTTLKSEIETLIPKFFTAPILNIAPVPFLIEDGNTFLVNQSPRFPNIELDNSKKAPKLVQTDVVGASLSFETPAQPVTFKSDALSILMMEADNQRGSFTLETWVQTNQRDHIITKSGKKYKTVISYNKWALQAGEKFRFVTKSDSPLLIKSKNTTKIGAWTHLAVTYDGESQNTELYVNGDQVENLSTVKTDLNGVGEQTLKLGANFSGQLAHIRLYDRVLTQKEIKGDLEQDFQIGSVGSKTLPLEFDLVNDGGDTVLYLNSNDKNSASQQLTLTLKNTSSKTLRLPSSGDTSLSLLELLFRPGTLRNPEQVSLAGATLSGTNLPDDKQNWTMQHFSEDDGTNIFKLERIGNTTTLPKTQAIAFTLDGFDVDDRGGARATRVQLRYALQTLDFQPISGSRQHYLSLVPMDATGLSDQVTSLASKTESIIKETSAKDLTIKQLREDLNQLAQVVFQVANTENMTLKMMQSAPIVAGVQGSATILNDGVSNNVLKIYLANPSDKALSFTNDTSQLIFEISRYNADNTPWGILTHDNNITAQTPEKYRNKWGNPEHNPSNTGLISYEFKPVANFKADTGIFFIVELTLDSSAPSGSGHILVRYDEIEETGGEKRSGHLIIPIQRTPIVIPPQQTATPRSVIAGELEMVDTPELTFRNQSYQETNSNGNIKAQTNASIRLDENQNLAIESDKAISLKTTSKSESLLLLSQVKATLPFVDSLEIKAGVVRDKDKKLKPSQKIGIYYTGHPGHLVPTGAIMMWSGAETEIPQGWHLCDGSKDHIPNLVNKFIVGGGDGFKYNEKGGGVDNITLTKDHMPKHNHEIYDPGHFHTMVQYTQSNVSCGKHSGQRDCLGRDYRTNPAKTGIVIREAGKGQPIDILPPYYALCFIIKL